MEIEHRPGGRHRHEPRVAGTLLVSRRGVQRWQHLGLRVCAERLLDQGDSPVATAAMAATPWVVASACGAAERHPDEIGLQLEELGRRGEAAVGRHGRERPTQRARRGLDDVGHLVSHALERRADEARRATPRCRPSTAPRASPTQCGAPSPLRAGRNATPAESGVVARDTVERVGPRDEAEVVDEPGEDVACVEHAALEQVRARAGELPGD